MVDFCVSPVFSIVEAQGGSLLLTFSSHVCKCSNGHLYPYDNQLLFFSPSFFVLMDFWLLHFFLMVCEWRNSMWLAMALNFCKILNLHIQALIILEKTVTITKERTIWFYMNSDFYDKMVDFWYKKRHFLVHCHFKDVRVVRL